MQRQNHRVCTLGAALALALCPATVIAQETVPELTGTVAFNVESASGRVERLAVTIGDGGTGQYKAILTGEPSLPTHAIYRPRDLRPFGGRNLLPIVAFGNGGCRNTSGEFRNFLSDLASQGFLVVAIGPAGNAVVMGSEERTNTTVASQLLDAVTWATAENARAGSAYFQKLDVSKVAVSGNPAARRRRSKSPQTRESPPQSHSTKASTSAPADADKTRLLPRRHRRRGRKPTAVVRVAAVQHRSETQDTPRMHPHSSARRMTPRCPDRLEQIAPRCSRNCTARFSSSTADQRIPVIVPRKRISKRYRTCRRSTLTRMWGTIRQLTGNPMEATLPKLPGRG